jgi:hypothetical protein
MEAPAGQHLTAADYRLLRRLQMFPMGQPTVLILPTLRLRSSKSKESERSGQSPPVAHEVSGAGVKPSSLLSYIKVSSYENHVPRRVS